MTGPEHYREAEDLLASDPLDEGHVAAAQVHATLALVAATIECASDINPPQEFPGNGNYITQGANAKGWQGVL